MKMFFPCLILMTVTSACATTRVVKVKPGKGGEIAVTQGIFGDARKEAHKKMNANCGKRKPVILEEGETVVGQHTRKESSKDKYSLVSYSDSEDKTEWRIKYRCR